MDGQYLQNQAFRIFFFKTPGFPIPSQPYNFNWLNANLSAYVKWAKTHYSLLIITFDEDDYKLGNHIPTFFTGPMIKPGLYDQTINHINLLHTIETMYNIPIRDTAKGKIIEDVWKP